jgi:arginine N-succinyltransferase
VTFRIRAARASDLPHLYEMAKLTGGGFTNLPPDKPSLIAKLDRSDAAFSRVEDTLDEDLFVLILEDSVTGVVRGTCQIFSRIGMRVPFYSYRIGTLTQHSKELGRTFRADMLTLSTDLEGSSEVGGLFLHPSERAGGLGMLIARSRYLFIRQHRARFADRTIAELRGLIDESGGSPFWDGVAGRFFGMNFQDADEFNAIHGHQFIADLMPKHPVYVAMLPESARAAIGLPHPSGRAAMRMLEIEGFAADCYIDIFDGGPTMCAATSRIRSIAEARTVTIARIAENNAPRAIVAQGRLHEFAAAWGRVDGDVIDPECARALNVDIGSVITVGPQ